jgi:hypothetical protein
MASKEPVSIVAAHIVTYAPLASGGTLIRLSRDNWRQVQESYTKVDDAVNSALRDTTMDRVLGLLEKFVRSI